jgi:hypothetical protein
MPLKDTQIHVKCNRLYFKLHECSHLTQNYCFISIHLSFFSYSKSTPSLWKITLCRMINNMNWSLTSFVFFNFQNQHKTIWKKTQFQMINNVNWLLASFVFFTFKNNTKPIKEHILFKMIINVNWFWFIRILFSISLG